MEADEYRKLAKVEDRMWYFRCLHRRLERGIAPYLQKVDTPVLLDAGCGTGGLLRKLHSHYPTWECEGIDLSPLACAEARSRGLKVQEASITQLPYSENHFNAAICGDVLYHLEKPEDGLRELSRVLKPGGVVAINVPAYRWLWSYHDERTGARWRFTRGQVVELLRAAGFAVRQATYWNTLPFPLIVARRKFFPPKNHESDVKVYPWLLERGFDCAMAAERAWTTVAPLPFGSSVFAVAQKT